MPPQKLREDIMDYGLKSIKLSGQHPESTSLPAKLFTFFYVSSTLALLGLIIAKFFFIHGDIDGIAQAFESFMTLAQAIFKLPTTLILKKKFLHVVEQRKYFWNVDDFDDEVKKDVDGVFKIAFRSLKLYRNCVIVLTIMMSIKPFFISKDPLPFVCYMFIEESLYFYIFLFVMQIFILIDTVLLVFGLDWLFGALCTHVITQFKLVNHKLQSIALDKISNERELENYAEEMKKCVEHHVFLLSFANDIGELYSSFLLGQYAISVVNTCMQLYYIFESNSDIAQLVKSIIYISTLVLELAFYCFPAQAVTDEALKVAQSAFATGWNSNYVPKFRQDLQIIILRSQEPIIMKAGGMIEINHETFVSVLQTAASFFTIMRTIKNLEK